MKIRVLSSLLAVVMAGASSLALAKLPAPTPEAQAKAAEAAAKSAWSGKVDNYKLCQAQDKVAAHYRRTAKDAKPAAATAACADPGPFVYTPPADKPVEAAAVQDKPGAASSPAGAAASAPKS